MHDVFERMRKQQEDMGHYYHYKKMQDERRREQQARKNGIITPRPSSLGQKVAKALGVIIAFGAIIIILKLSLA